MYNNQNGERVLSKTGATDEPRWDGYTVNSTKSHGTNLLIWQWEMVIPGQLPMRI